MIGWLLRLAIAGGALFVVLGLFAPFHPAMDALAQFRLHAVAGLGVLCLLAAFALMLRWAIAGVVICAVALVLTWPYLPFVKGQEAGISVGRSVSIIQLNLLYNSSEIGKARALVARENPDFWLFQETTDHTGVVLADLKKSHPHQLRCRAGRVGAPAIASRHPFIDGSERLCSGRVGLAAARFLVGGRPITIASVHLHWPWPFEQYAHIKRLAPDLAGLEAPLIVAGDFNSAPWTHSVSMVANHARIGVAGGAVATWMPFRATKALTPWFGLPLDNVLHDPALNLVQRQVLPDAGSDHRPILSRFILK